MLVLHGNPLSTGSIYRSACQGNFPRTYMTHEGKALKEAYQLQAQAQWKEGLMLRDLEVEVRFYFSRKGKHDIDNHFKILFDSLTGIVWKDDTQIVRLVAEKFIDREHPRIEVRVL